jgi:hypothetical protein
MSATIPIYEPSVIVAGDTLAWTKTLADYSAADGWVLSYVLTLASVAPSNIAITATASGSDHAISVTAATTAAYVAGTYHWASYVTKAAERYTLESGTVVISPNPASVSPSDPRTHAEKCLAAIEAVIEGRMSDPIVEYQIGNRMAKKIPHADLMKLRTLYKTEVRVQRGGPRIVAIPVRFSRV